jgi:D-glutamate cyclase
MVPESELVAVGEIVDRLLSVPIFTGSSLSKKPVLLELYDAARAKFGAPLTYLASKWLAENLQPGDTVVILTGFIVPPWLRPENDGPVGAVNLARALNLAFDVTPVIVGEREVVLPMPLLCRAGGLEVADFITARRTTRRVALEAFTVDASRADADAEQLLDRITPKAVISIEKGSVNEVGVHHSGVGYDVSAMTAKVDRIVEAARARGIWTLGIGDGGNEIGMGCIKDTIKSALATGSNCGCPCGHGTHAATATDLLLPVMVSNWAAPGLEANLAVRLGTMEVLHDRAMEGKLLETAADAGFIDPASGLSISNGDGVDKNVHLAIVDILNFIAKTRIADSFYIRKYRWYVTERRTDIQKNIAEWSDVSAYGKQGL